MCGKLSNSVHYSEHFADRYPMTAPGFSMATKKRLGARFSVHWFYYREDWLGMPSHQWP
jgi:hypothetical protein